MARTTRVLIALLATGWLSACGGGFGLRCEDPARYTDSGEIAPVRIPDDLSPPDESESLRIPAPAEGEIEQVSSRGACLESPPDFYEASPPG